MSDAFWKAFWENLPAILLTLPILYAAWRAGRAEKAAKGAKSAAEDASKHANGAFKRLEERLDSAQQGRMDDLKESRDKVIDALQESVPASSVGASSATPPVARVEVQVTSAPQPPRPARAGDPVPNPPSDMPPDPVGKE